MVLLQDTAVVGHRYSAEVVGSQVPPQGAEGAGHDPSSTSHLLSTDPMHNNTTNIPPKSPLVAERHFLLKADKVRCLCYLFR